MVVGPEFLMEPPESTEYAKAILEVAKHYPVRGFDDKMMAWFNLSQIVVIGYGSRIMMLRARVKSQGRAAPQAPPQPRTMPPAPGVQGNVQQPPGQPPPARPNGASAANRGEIPGVGEVEFPPDHPLNPNRGKLQ